MSNLLYFMLLLLSYSKVIIASHILTFIKLKAISMVITSRLQLQHCCVHFVHGSSLCTWVCPDACGIFLGVSYLKLSCSQPNQIFLSHSIAFGFCDTSFPLMIATSEGWSLWEKCLAFLELLALQVRFAKKLLTFLQRWKHRVWGYRSNYDKGRHS